MRWLPLLLLPLALASLAAQAADAPKGRIAYTRKEGDRILLHLMNADGTGDFEVPGQTSRYNLLPTWSPDGKRLAFVTAGPGTLPRVNLVGSDGADLKALETSAAFAAMPAWSPDGKHLAFSGRTGVYVCDADGANSRRVGPEGSPGYFPFWTADGKSVGFTRPEADRSKGEIVLAKVDGNGDETLTQTGKIPVAGANALSPDGKRLLYLSADPATKKGFLCIFDLATRVETKLLELDMAYTEEIVAAPLPAWSPDGKSVLLPLPTDKGRGLFRVSDDGKTRVRLTPEGVDVFSGAWSAK
jgi:TolB protein